MMETLQKIYSANDFAKELLSLAENKFDENKDYTEIINHVILNIMPELKGMSDKQKEVLHRTLINREPISDIVSSLTGCYNTSLVTQFIQGGAKYLMHNTNAVKLLIDGIDSTKPVDETYPLICLGLDSRTYGPLTTSMVSQLKHKTTKTLTISDLLSFSKQSLQNTRVIGKKRISQIESKLADIGLHLTDTDHRDDQSKLTVVKNKPLDVHTNKIKKNNMDRQLPKHEYKPIVHVEKLLANVEVLKNQCDGHTDSKIPNRIISQNQTNHIIEDRDFNLLQNILRQYGISIKRENPFEGISLESKLMDLNLVQISVLSDITRLIDDKKITFKKLSTMSMDEIQSKYNLSDTDTDVLIYNMKLLGIEMK